MRKVKENDTVTVTYDGILKDGEIFESSQDTGPLSFQLGSNAVMAAFEETVLGMQQGETRSVTVAPEHAFGFRQEELVVTVPKNSVSENIEAKPGMILALNMEKEGQQHKVPALVTDVCGDQLTVDFNHPLAGQELIYKITVQAINEESCNTTNGAGCGCGN